MKKLFFIFTFWFCFATLEAQTTKQELYSIAFYNVENLFDTIHDTGKNDYEFLPDGS